MSSDDTLSITVEFRYIPKCMLCVPPCIDSPQRRTRDSLCQPEKVQSLAAGQRRIGPACKYCIPRETSLWQCHEGSAQGVVCIGRYCVSADILSHGSLLMCWVRRPGILVLINEADWELEGEDKYEVQERDHIMFVSTLHGG